LPIGGITATGTPSASTFLRGDSSWATISTGLTINTTVITGGTTGRILYDNAGTVGELTTVPTANGGTNLSTFTAANNAIYSTSASVLTAGTLPILAGGTGATTAAAALTNLGAASVGTAVAMAIVFGG
jgi:hypothetical protein